MKIQILVISLLLFSCKPEGVENEKIESNLQEQSNKTNDNKDQNLSIKAKKLKKKLEIDQGIRISYFEEGKGEQIKDNDVLQLDYEVYLDDGTFVDGNKLLKRAWLPFIVGFEMQTPGWDIALRKLRVGDFVKIFLPSKVARGEVGIKGLIPPNASNTIRLKILGKLKPSKVIDGTKVWLLEENKAEKLKANLKSTVDFHYMVSTPSNPKYDISYRKNLPYSLKFSDFGIIKGLKKALINAKKSDKIWVLIPPDQAYGSKGLEHLIKPNEFVFYDLFVMDVR